MRAADCDPFVGKNRRFFRQPLAPFGRRGLLSDLAEALAVGALILGGIGLMGADLDGVQAAVVHLAAVMGAAGDGAFDGRVGGAGAPVVGTIGHSFLPP